MGAVASRPAPAVRWTVTVLVLIVALSAGAALVHRSAIFVEGTTGVSLYNSGEPGLAYPHLQAAVRGTLLYARPCIDLGDMAVWAIDDGVFQRYYGIDDAWSLAKLAFLSYAEALRRQPGSAKAWAGMGELFKKVRTLRIKEGVLELDAIGEGAPPAYDEEDRLVIEAYRRAVRSEPNNYFYHAYLGDFFDERGFRTEALHSYARAVEIMPDLSWHYYLPRVNVPEDLYAATSEALQRALESNPGFPKDRIWQNMGDLAERGRNPDAAAEYYQRAAAIAADPSPYLQILGALYFTEKRYDEAEKVLRQALERGTLQPRMKTLAHTLLGRAAMIRGDYAAALEQLQRARWLNPSSAYVALDLARVYEAQKMYEKAEIEYQAALRLDPTRASAYSELINLYRKTRQITKAISLAQRLVEMFPENQIFKDQLTALRRELGRGGTG